MVWFKQGPQKLSSLTLNSKPFTNTEHFHSYNKEKNHCVKVEKIVMKLENHLAISKPLAPTEAEIGLFFRRLSKCLFFNNSTRTFYHSRIKLHPNQWGAQEFGWPIRGVGRSSILSFREELTPPTWTTPL